MLLDCDENSHKILSKNSQSGTLLTDGVSNIPPFTYLVYNCYLICQLIQSIP